MIMSRGMALGKISSDIARQMILKNKRNTFNQNFIRWHNRLYYRSTPKLNEWKPQPAYVVVTSIIWWWILWHLFTDYHELIGHRAPDPSKWTDEELGIPPEDAD